ncbi:HAD family hydrolase [Caldibacillus thermoamylovorans]|uniref:HAD family hydrolase n=1 Tax=Caldibacillus thermoamylovorans TaxID=35841 RepID=UPI001D085D13|nr:HAD family hydrolase [Caldibacillus thermoamylovorans]MCB5936680.1 HAD family hydrolase [Bacillus sp. DFI.2.34]MCB7078202.1 HAD family hydrolase [Caldibacillus thermoamylovorans]
MNCVIFDLDDTLYDQLQPFKTAFEKVFPEVTDIPIEQIYNVSRKYSDQLFQSVEKGVITFPELQVQRMIHAFHNFEQKISVEQAREFQSSYQFEQGRITLYPQVRQLLNQLKVRRIQLAILTNGPLEHQKKKIEQLNLLTWIPTSRIFISGRIGFAKPNIKAFQYVEKKMNLTEQPIYIGDSYTNDVVGAKKAGWQAIWVNHRKKTLDNIDVRPDLIVRNHDELLNYFLKKFHK